MLITYDLGDMTRIQTRLYLGTIDNALNLHQENPKGITHILNCTDDVRLDFLECKTPIHVVRLDHKDGEPYPVGKVYKAMGFISRSLATIPDSKVLVCCHAGRSRSASIMAGFLYTGGLTWDEAIKLVREKRPIINPSPVVLKSVKRAFGLDDY